MALEEHVAEQDIQIRDLRNKVDFFVRSSLPPVEGIFFDGQIFDAYAHIISLIKQAKTSITLIDNYINVDTLTMLTDRSKYTDAVEKALAEKWTPDGLIVEQVAVDSVDHSDLDLIEVRH